MGIQQDIGRDELCTVPYAFPPPPPPHDWSCQHGTLMQRLAIEEGLDAPDGPRSQLHAADAVSRTTIRPTSGANRAAAPPRLGRSGK